MTYWASFRESAQESQRQRATKHEIEPLQNLDLHAADLALGVRVIGHIDKVLDGRHVHLLVLGGQEHGSDANELQLFLKNKKFE